MNKRKAIICTVLYTIVLTAVLIASWFIKSHMNGISLYQMIVSAIGNMWIGSTVGKFYNWLRK